MIRRTKSRGPRAGARLSTTLLAAVVPLAACDSDASGPDGNATGTVEVVVTDNPQGGSPILAPGDRTATASSGPASDFSGTLHGDFQASISVDGQTWVDLGSLTNASVQLQSSGTETSIHGRKTVPVGTYTRVRLVMDGAQADLAAGSTIGTVTLTTAASVTLGTDGTVTVVLAVPPFTLQANTNARVAFDLNSEAWMSEPAVALGVATENEVATSVTAGVSMSPN